MSDNRWADLLDEQYLGMIERIAEAEERQVELLEQLVEQTCDTGGDPEPEPEPEPETEDDPRHQLMGEFGLSERQAETALELADEFEEPRYSSDMGMVDQPYALAEELDITYGRGSDIHHYLLENGFLVGGSGDTDTDELVDPSGRHQDRLMGEFNLSESEAKMALKIVSEWAHDKTRAERDLIELANMLVGTIPITYQQVAEIRRDLREHGFISDGPGEHVDEADSDKEHLDEMARLFGVTPIEGRAALRMIRKFDPPTSKAEADRHTRLLDKTLDIPTPTLASIYSYCQYHRLLGSASSDTDTDADADAGGGA